MRNFWLRFFLFKILCRGPRSQKCELRDVIYTKARVRTRQELGIAPIGGVVMVGGGSLLLCLGSRTKVRGLIPRFSSFQYQGLAQIRKSFSYLKIVHATLNPTLIPAYLLFQDSPTEQISQIFQCTMPYAPGMKLNFLQTPYPRSHERGPNCTLTYTSLQQPQPKRFPIQKKLPNGIIIILLKLLIFFTYILCPLPYSPCPLAPPLLLNV